jgi:hypothetical protein
MLMEKDPLAVATALSDALRSVEDIKATLEDPFFPTSQYQKFRERVFSVLEAREVRLQKGLLQQKGAALIAPAGVGKTRLVKQVISEFEAVAEATGGRKYGHRILSVTVPGRATVKDTSKAILRKLGYPVESPREDDYLVRKLITLMEQQRYAGLHLDEFQDAGRHTTAENMQIFTKRFRNMMDDSQWPICLILTGTLEGKDFINLDPTLSRRLKPIEMLPINFGSDGKVLRDAAATLLGKSGINDDLGLFSENEFVKILIHASAYRFGVAIELIIEAIGAALMENEEAITLDHFAEAYYVRASCEDDQNPFVARNWKIIDSSKVFDRLEDAEPKPKKRRRKL